ADLVAHGAGGEEQGRFAPQQLGHAVLKAVDGRVEPALLVAHLRLGHRPPHALAGARLRVAPEVDLAGRQESSRRSSAIRSTARAASSPVWRLPPPARAIACSISSTVRTPKEHGTPVSRPTRAIPRAASEHT